MKKFLLAKLFVAVQLCMSIHCAFGHPGTGIVVDKNGNVYFIYSGVGVGKISPDGKLSWIQHEKDGHWLCLDEQGFFSQAKPKYFDRITPNGVKPTILFAGGGSPILVNRDGYFYYCGGEHGDLNPGGKSLVKESVSQQQTLFPPALEDSLDKLNDGITGLATAPDGSIYLACWNSLLKVAMDGKITILLHPVPVKDCDEDPADHREANRGIPLLRGIDVDSSGTVYAAATSCHCVVKFEQDKRLSTVLKAERPWSPTGVAIRNGSIYVLEYTNANGLRTEGWYPRVIKIDQHGKISTLVDLSAGHKISAG